MEYKQLFCVRFTLIESSFERHRNFGRHGNTFERHGVGILAVMGMLLTVTAILAVTGSLAGTGMLLTVTGILAVMGMLLTITGILAVMGIVLAVVGMLLQQVFSCA